MASVEDTALPCEGTLSSSTHRSLIPRIYCMTEKELVLSLRTLIYSCMSVQCTAPSEYQ